MWLVDQFPGPLALFGRRAVLATGRWAITNAAIVAIRCSVRRRDHAVVLVPRSEADLQRAIDGALLRETHYLDCKRESGETSGERKETARDLASFAIDGGALLVGVDEDKNNRSFSLAPQPLTGLVERVEDIAATIIDPPLDVTPYEIKSEQQQGCGYLLVEVRPSPFAPHMVDGVYYGRGEKKAHPADRCPSAPPPRPASCGRGRDSPHARCRDRTRSGS